MLTKKEICELESGNPGIIHLYAEGMFYRAYEQSAFLLCTLIHPFKLSCRFVKAVGDYLTCVGFPQSSVGKWADGREVISNSAGVDIRLGENEPVDFSRFPEWKSALVHVCNQAPSVVCSLPERVYGEAYGLCMDLCRLCANLERSYRYSLGEQLRLASFRMVLEIRDASGKESIAHISSARGLLSEVQLCLRLLADLNAIHRKRYLTFVESTESISRQLIAWERSKPNNNCRNAGAVKYTGSAQE